MSLAEVGLEYRQMRQKEALQGLRDVRQEAEKFDATNQRMTTSSKRASDAVVKMVQPTTQARTAMAQYGQTATQAGYQIQDFAIQVAGGQSAMTAFAQQAPQLLGAFGMTGKLALYGSLAGTAVAVTAAIVPYFLNAASASMDWDDALDELNNSLDRLNDQASSSGIADLIERYGEATTAVREMVKAQRELEQLLAGKALRDAQKSLADLGEDTFDDLSRIDNAGRTGRNALERLQEEFNLTASGAREMRDAFEEAASAEGPEAIAGAYRDVYNLIIDAVGGTQNLTDEQMEFVRALLEGEDAARRYAAVDTTSGTSATADEAGRLADNMALAALNRRLYEQSGRANTPGRGDGWAQVDAWRNRAQGWDQSEADRLYDEWVANQRKLELAANRTGRSSRSGRGGKSDAQKQFEDDQRTAEQLWKSTRTAAEEYAIQVAEIQRLDEAGFFDGMENGADVAKRAIEGLGEELRKSNEMGQAFSSGLGNAMREIENGVDNAGEALADLGKQLLRAAIAKQLISGFNLSGTLLGDVLSSYGGITSFDGGGYTGTGSRSGGMDGKGGFMAMLHPNETVVDHTKGQNAGGGTQVIVNNNGSGEATVSRSQGPDGRELVEVTVNEQMARGRYDRSMSGRYGAKPRGVRV